MMNSKALLALTLILGSTVPAFGLTAPRVVKQNKQVGRLELGPDVTAALTKFDSEFKLFTAEDFIPSVRELFSEDAPEQTPMALVADFNGDGRADAAVTGYAHGERLTLGVLSTADGYEVSVIDRQVLVRPQDSLFPPMVQDANVSDESEGLINREKGLFDYLTLVPNQKRAPRDGAKHFKTDALLMETFQSNDARLFRVVGRAFREWKPGR